MYAVAAKVVGVTPPGADVEIETDVAEVWINEGSTGTFRVRLTEEPGANVTVSVARSSGSTEITVQSGSSLTFTPANYSAWQTVTLAAAADDDYLEEEADFACTADGMDTVTVTAHVVEASIPVPPPPPPDDWPVYPTDPAELVDEDDDGAEGSWIRLLSPANTMAPHELLALQALSQSAFTGAGATFAALQVDNDGNYADAGLVDENDVAIDITTGWAAGYWSDTVKMPAQPTLIGAQLWYVWAEARKTGFQYIPWRWQLVPLWLTVYMPDTVIVDQAFTLTIKASKGPSGVDSWSDITTRLGSSLDGTYDGTGASLTVKGYDTESATEKDVTLVLSGGGAIDLTTGWSGNQWSASVKLTDASFCEELRIRADVDSVESPSIRRDSAAITDNTGYCSIHKIIIEREMAAGIDLPWEVDGAYVATGIVHHNWEYYEALANINTWSDSYWVADDVVAHASAHYKCLLTHDADPVWGDSLPYVVGDYVYNDVASYKCIQNHTSGTDADEPGVGANWANYWLAKGYPSTEPGNGEYTATYWVLVADEPGVGADWADLWVIPTLDLAALIARTNAAAVYFVDETAGAYAGGASAPTAYAGTFADAAVDIASLASLILGLDANPGLKKTLVDPAAMYAARNYFVGSGAGASYAAAFAAAKADYQDAGPSTSRPEANGTTYSSSGKKARVKCLGASIVLPADTGNLLTWKPEVWFKVVERTAWGQFVVTRDFNNQGQAWAGDTKDVWVKATEAADYVSAGSEWTSPDIISDAFIAAFATTVATPADSEAKGFMVSDEYLVILWAFACEALEEQ